MQRTVGHRRSGNGTSAQCGSTVGLCVHLPNGGVMRLDAPVGQSISSALVAQGVPLKRVSDGDAVTLLGLGGSEQSSRLGGQIALAPEHDGLEIVLDADSVEPQTYWTAG